jgi:RHS repeat-associated protein
VTEEDGTVRSWEYDELYRLTRERVTDGDGALVYENAFTYDPVGNRTEQVQTAADGSVETLVYGYDARDRLSSETVTGGGATSSGWDANGNLTSETGPEGTTVYGWDFENRLVSVELADGTVVGNRYDADDVRMASVVTPVVEPTSTTGYVTDTSGSLSQVIAEIDAGGELGVHYARGQQLLGLLRDGQERYVHADHIGSARALTDVSANLEDSYSYGAFGHLLGSPGIDPISFLFGGEQKQEALDLYYLRARWLDISLGRFLNQDPYSGRPEYPMMLHKYVYAGNDPVNKVDPTGLFLTAAEAVASLGTRLSLNVKTQATSLIVAATLTCAAIASINYLSVSTTISSGGSVKGPVVPPPGFRHCGVNQMRVQLQTGKQTFGLVASATPATGVTSVQVQQRLRDLYYSRGALNWYPSRLDSNLFSAIIRMSKAINRFVLGGGVYLGENVAREKFVDPKTGQRFRLDLENLRGHNLRF